MDAPVALQAALPVFPMGWIDSNARHRSSTGCRRSQKHSEVASRRTGIVIHSQSVLEMCVF
jgi:hypothetical protein